jgi:ribulose-phosphate 3-epimerase
MRVQVSLRAPSIIKLGEAVMAKEIKVSASILSADFNNLGDEIKKCEDAGVDMIHVDVMDGHFVPNISIGWLIVEAIRPITNLPIDVHLMIENPGVYVERFADAGADMISVHAECYGDRREHCQSWNGYPKEIEVVDVLKVKEDILKIKNKGKQALMVLNPGTPVSSIKEVLTDLDGVLMMSVNPGFSNQKFMSEAIPKIEQLRNQYGFSGDISIDGGVSDKTAPAAVAAGANILATASYFFGANDHRQAVDFLRNLGK